MKPLLKWLGGKRRVVPHILPYIPENYNLYYEPFFGGGAVYLHLLPEKAVISDVNKPLINVYQQVKENPEALIEELEHERWKNTLEDYLEIRALDREEEFEEVSDLFKAARILYLNKTCFNGLYRENKKGQYNAHFGHYKDPQIKNPELIREMSKQFNRGTEIKLAGFQESLSQVEGTSNLIYLDPPYIPLNTTSYFTSYSKDGFNDDDHVSLAEKMRELDEKGNYVLMSNSDTPRTAEIYKDFHFIKIQVGRSISAKGTSRGKVGEILAVGNSLYEELKRTGKL